MENGIAYSHALTCAGPGEVHALKCMLHLLRIFYERALERSDPNGAALPRTDRVVGREQEDTYSPGTDKYSKQRILAVVKV
jgi:hypothetical protein